MFDHYWNFINIGQEPIHPRAGREFALLDKVDGILHWLTVREHHDWVFGFSQDAVFGSMAVARLRASISQQLHFLQLSFNLEEWYWTGTSLSFFMANSMCPMPGWLLAVSVLITSWLSGCGR